MLCCIVTITALTGKEYWCKNVFHCCDWLNSRNHSKKEIPMQNCFALLCLIALQRTLHWHKALLWILLLNFHDWLYCHDLLPYHKNLLQPRLGLLEDRKVFLSWQLSLSWRGHAWSENPWCRRDVINGRSLKLTRMVDSCESMETGSCVKLRTIDVSLNSSVESAAAWPPTDVDTL